MKEFQNLPIYQKAQQIVKLTDALCTTIPEDDVLLQAAKDFMRENAYMIPAKIAGAEAGDLYDIRMENASLIRKAARELYVQAGSLKMATQHDYQNLLRTEIDNFKILFVDWVRNFDQWNYINDDWGLFNPPGI